MSSDLSKVKKNIASLREEVRKYRKEVTQVQQVFMRNTQWLKQVLNVIKEKEIANGQVRPESKTVSDEPKSSD